ncbi:MAG: hypothetical protein NC922_00575 [Candidatus Omnitrophica bacterium]|nr:hypothetical protein [Candidatus Omnitrophota bacterium]
MYKEATNHYALGELIEENDRYIKLRCKTFHFKNPMLNKGIYISDIKFRIFPWHTISYILEIPEEVNWEEALPFIDEKGEIILKTERLTYKIEENRNLWF